MSFNRFGRFNNINDNIEQKLQEDQEKLHYVQYEKYKGGNFSNDNKKKDSHCLKYKGGNCLKYKGGSSGGRQPLVLDVYWNYDNVDHKNYYILRVEGNTFNKKKSLECNRSSIFE